MLVHLFRAIDPCRQKRGPSIPRIFWEIGTGARGGRSVIDNMYRPREERR